MVKFREDFQETIERHPHFAAIYRPGRYALPQVEILAGSFSEVATLADIHCDPALRRTVGTGALHQTLSLVPFRQVRERGFAAPDDGVPLLTMVIEEQMLLPVAELEQGLSKGELNSVQYGFDLDDQAYAEIAARIIKEEIGRGEGANFVLKRSLLGKIHDFSLEKALLLFLRLLQCEPAAHWVYMIRSGTDYVIGASPEKHISARGSDISMMPISGTLRIEGGAEDETRLLQFLEDGKEINELLMVVDEELKMMACICDGNVTATGPTLLPMASIVHTSYSLHGTSSLPAGEMLRHTLFSPAVTGSPLQNACRVIEKYEPQGRGYYSGLFALTGFDEKGDRELDSVIAIRTCYIDQEGRFRIPVGATIVKDSDPLEEAGETRAKAQSLIDAIEGKGRGGRVIPHSMGELAETVAVKALLTQRNVNLNRFWLQRGYPRVERAGAVRDRLLVLNAEDDFTAMLGAQLERIGFDVTVKGYEEPFEDADYDFALLGPGPGDPTQLSDPKIMRLRAIAREWLRGRRPFVAVCLGHQIVSSLLGLPVAPYAQPQQGSQRKICYFGSEVTVGFYNTFSAWAESNEAYCKEFATEIEISRAPQDGEVFGVRSNFFQTAQFHPESILSKDGLRILGDFAAFLREQRQQSLSLTELRHG
ncbi:anthranilate synthase family protein [Agrobacterium vitis]|uniref:anthranilate synthase family protein n=1 Tax=Agrobacterium vitis TaxID=373 RepID=UPI003D2D2AC0